MRLPPEYLGEVIAELRSRQRIGDSSEEQSSLQKQLERWRKLFVMGEIDEMRLKTETAPIKRRLSEIDRPHEILDVEAAAGLLRCMGTLWSESLRNLQQDFVREVFQRIGVEGKAITAITPSRNTLRSLSSTAGSVSDRSDLNFVVWLPGQESSRLNYKTASRH